MTASFDRLLNAFEAGDIDRDGYALGCYFATKGSGRVRDVLAKLFQIPERTFFVGFSIGWLGTELILWVIKC